MRKIVDLKTLPGVVVALGLMVPMSAGASNKVSSPDITKGKTELEYRGGYDVDSNPAEDGSHTHKFVANYGLMDWWRTEVKGILTDSGRGADWTFVEWSNRFQLIKDHEWLPKLSLQENYKFSLLDAKPDKFETTILMSKTTGPLIHVTNINFENEIGDHAKGGTNFNLGWRTNYRLMPEFEPGVEFYLDFGKFGTKTSGPKKHLVGPVFMGKITEGLKYELGFLAGVTKAAPEGRFKWIFTYSFNAL